MTKLNIEYRTKEQERKNCFKNSTYFTFIIKDRTTVISIAPNETRKLKDIIYGIEEELQDGYHLQKYEKFEISKFDKYVIEYEEKYATRIDELVYNFVKNKYRELQDGLITVQELISRTENYIKEKILL
jgi:hypothetical protein